MDERTLNQIWQQASKKPYKGKSLFEWLRVWVEASQGNLDHATAQFLPVMTGWIVARYREGRKGGVPVGYLYKFVPKGHVNLLEILTVMLVSILRKRGLREADTLPTPQFTRLVEAWDRAKQSQSRR